jgi:dTDP-4-amino-4,6-dideoxygalactose transaminase
MTGTFGLAGCFSFFPSKNLGGYGDGGLVTTNSAETAEKLRMLRNHGSKVRYHHDVIGFNSRLDELQAVILRIKLKHIATYNTERRRVAHRYSAALAHLRVTPPFEDGIGTHVYHQYTLLSAKRDAIMAKLSERQIASAIYYPIPLHKQNVYAVDCAGLSLPVAEDIASRCLSLPIFPEMTSAQVDEVVAAIREALA